MLGAYAIHIDNIDRTPKKCRLLAVNLLSLCDFQKFIIEAVPLYPKYYPSFNPCSFLYSVNGSYHEKGPHLCHKKHLALYGSTLCVLFTTVYLN